VVIFLYLVQEDPITMGGGKKETPPVSGVSIVLGQSKN
jgi:hypothetical protein